LLPEQRLMIERNLKRVHGPDFGGLALRRAVQASLEYYARYWVESFRLPGTSPEALDAGMSFDGLHHIENAIDRGIGPIMALPHLGGWEWGGFWLASTYRHRMTVVVEALEPPELFEWFVALRQSFGMNVVPLGHGAGTAVANAIKNVDIVCLLCDRDLTGKGIEVEFFGERTTLPAGPATLALRTGAPLLPAAVYYRGKGHPGLPARRRHPGHPGPGPRAGGPDPGRARAVAPPPAQLAQRPRRPRGAAVLGRTVDRRPPAHHPDAPAASRA